MKNNNYACECERQKKVTHWEVVVRDFVGEKIPHPIFGFHLYSTLSMIPLPITNLLRVPKYYKYVCAAHIVFAPQCLSLARSHQECL